MQYDCLKKDSEGYPYLEYYQPKTLRYNQVPISKRIEKVVREQQAEAETLYPGTKYLFPIAVDKPMSQETFSYHINRLAYRHKIKDSSGKMFRVRSHMFRHTVATRMAEAGMGADIIRDMLGHKTFKSVMPYIELTKLKEDKKLEAFIQKEDEMLKATLKTEPKEEKEVIPLLNGYCTKGGDLCETAYICYSCGMFIMEQMDRKHLQEYLKELEELQKEALESGMERKAELLANLQKAVLKQLPAEAKEEMK